MSEFVSATERELRRLAVEQQDALDGAMGT